MKYVSRRVQSLFRLFLYSTTTNLILTLNIKKSGIKCENYTKKKLLLRNKKAKTQVSPIRCEKPQVSPLHCIL